MRQSLILTASYLVASVALAAPINTESDGIDSSIPSEEDIDIMNPDILGALLDAYYLQESNTDVKENMEDANLMLANTGIDPNDTSGDIPETESATDISNMDAAEAPELPELIQLFELEDVDTSSIDTSIPEDTAAGVAPSKRQVDDVFDQAFPDEEVPIIVEEPKTEE